MLALLAATPNEAIKTGITFFGTWIGRIGGIVAFIGAVKFALSVKSEDGKEQMTALLVMVSGFMIRAAIKEMNLFTIPGSEFTALVSFISKWIRRVGAVGAFVGAVMFALSVKDHNAGSKITAMKTLTAGAMVVSIAALLPSMV
jgi:hypothetical protein